MTGSDVGVPLIDVQAHRRVIGDEIDARIQAVLEHGRYILGPEVAEFESALADHIGGDVEAVTCANGTDALVLALLALGVEPGDAVVCPSFTFVASAEAVAAIGAVPVFADVTSTTFNVDASSVAAALADADSRGLRVAGVMAVDLFGRPAPYPELRRLTGERGVWLLADAAQSFGASLGGTKVGALADVTTTSFFPAKPLGCYGDGGAVFTADRGIADTLRSLRVHGKGEDKYHNVRVGQNSRLDTLQAAVLLPKLAILDGELDDRDRVAASYARRLPTELAPPAPEEELRSAWAQYTITTSNRTDVQAALADAGIGNAVYYPVPLHLQPAYAQFHSEGAPLVTSERLADVVISLPMHPYLSDDEIDAVVTTVARVATGSVGI